MNDAATATSRVAAVEDRRAVSVLRLVLFGLLAMVMLGAASAAVDAKGATHAEQNGFVQNCRHVGATPKRVASRVVACNFDKPGMDGGSITCNFNHEVPRCTYKLDPRVGADRVPFDEVDDAMQTAADSGGHRGDIALPPADDAMAKKATR